MTERQSSPFELAVRELPREVRAAQGSGQITAWCPTCQENAVPMRNGTCAFCDTVIAPPTVNGHGPLPEPEREPEPGKLRLGEDLLLPLDAATESLAILAVKGAGKSNAAAVLAEELFDEGIPWIVIDPKGDWWGIREAVGVSRGLPVVVLGGLHGDLPLSPQAGPSVAGLIVERNLTCVLDISAMDDEERPTFLAALGDHLFELHRTSPSVRHIIVEEAGEVVPERAPKEMRSTLKAWTRIVCQGRQRGLGITLVSQRSALVSKNVLTQTGSLLVLRTTSPQDRKVIRDWTDFHSVSRELVDSLPGLANGEAWIVAPSWLHRVERVRLRRRWTFDSGATPEVLATRRAQMLDSIDIEDIGRVLSGQLELAQPDGAPLEPDPDPDPQAAILERLAEGPAKRGELARETGLSESKLYQVLRELAAAGKVRMEGATSAAVWMLAGAEQSRELDDVESAPARGAVAPGAELARTFVSARRTAEDVLEQLDEILGAGEDSLTLLRARYLAVLLRRIEAGETDEALLDRFERMAGFTT